MNPKLVTIKQMNVGHGCPQNSRTPRDRPRAVRDDPPLHRRQWPRRKAPIAAHAVLRRLSAGLSSRVPQRKPAGILRHSGRSAVTWRVGALGPVPRRGGADGRTGDNTNSGTSDRPSRSVEEASSCQQRPATPCPTGSLNTSSLTQLSRSAQSRRRSIPHSRRPMPL